MTGPIKFKEGKRVDFKLDLLKLKTTKLTKVRIREGWVSDPIGSQLIAEKMIESMKIKWLKIATGQCMIAGK